MLPEDQTTPNPPFKEQWFTTTPWGIVLAARQGNSLEAADALETLCRSYWYPLYAYVRRRGYNAEAAQDLVQEFFARLLAKNYLQSVNAERGKFRSFLLASLNHFLANEFDRSHALKRGAGQTIISLDDEDAEERYRLEPADGLTPAMIFERRWALTVLEDALRKLRTEFVTSGREPQFERLKGFLEGEVGRGDYDVAAKDLKVSRGAVAMAVQRLRQRYKDLVRAEVADTVADPAEVEPELRHLMAVLT